MTTGPGSAAGREEEEDEQRSNTVLRADDPARVLGVSSEADSEEIRAAYLRKVKEHPPERDPEAFERIRDAYEVMRDPRRRLRHLLLAADPDATIASLLEGLSCERRFVGPGAWLEILRGGS